ncbi:MAG TPA: XdhC family protein [Stellaceae bacterium]|nr:XdhC family protein [Stellaceae bacterium]
MKGRILDRVVAAGREHRSVALATELASGRQLLLDGQTAEGDLTLDAPALDRVREIWRSGRNRTVETAKGAVFVEVLTPPHRCFVIGAVHIAQPLAQMLTLADYAVTVIDPRGAFATAARFPNVELVSEWPDEALERLQPDRGSAVIALTHDPKLDDPALAAALRSESFYIGALGSRRNHAGRCARLKELGFADTDLARIHGPIGLAIGAISPAEVAISIVAEMTRVLRQGEAAEAVLPAQQDTHPSPLG